MHPVIKLTLESNGIAYIKHQHTNFKEDINSPSDVAKALGYDIKRITKTVFLRSATREKFAMAVCSIDEKLNFPLLATHLGIKKVEVASKDELQLIVGYPSTAVSPIGLKNIPVFMDGALFRFNTVLVGAGIPGVEIEIAPSDLQVLSGASILSIAF